MSKSNQATKSNQAPAKPNKPAPAKPNGMAAVLTPLTTTVNVTPAAPAKVTASAAVLATITTNGNKGSGSLPPAFAGKGAARVTLGSKASSAAWALRLNGGTNKAGQAVAPCPFAMALAKGAAAGQTLAQAWQPVAGLAGHTQVRGGGAYTAGNALAYYVKAGWVVLA